MSGRKHVPRPLSVFKQTSRASKLLALVPPINALSDVENQNSSNEEIVISTCRQDSDDLSSEAPSILSSLENLDISEGDEDRNNASEDEIPNSELEDQELAVPLTPIINQVLPLTSMSGIVYDFLLYGGEDTFRYIQFTQAEETLTLGAKVVIALCKKIQMRACVVYFDNYFSTLDLAIHLRDECGVFSLGTIRQNRLKGCEKLLMSDKSLKKKGRGSYCQVVDNDNKVATVKWYDNKVVTLISTYADAYPVGKMKRYSKEMKARVDVDCPELIKHYNSNMGGVDLADYAGCVVSDFL
ncbi:uncharacterized protein LOC111359170 [Spodoptera litura]|uniref:Uncharacterized protein LOC111359170 n=1 Tax=Spodoptera litura TaxID=69820 RepID=A0A9J7EL06_SPOLT|nr:uncharacterized protein LOC111359170 [Spodoptera litura]